MCLEKRHQSNIDKTYGNIFAVETCVGALWYYSSDGICLKCVYLSSDFENEVTLEYFVD